MMEARTWSISWNDAMSVGIAEVDEDHRRFIALLDRFNEAVSSRMALTEVQVRLQSILDDALAHFAREEELFRQWRYAQADDHARMHGQLVESIRQTKSKVSDGTDVQWINAGFKLKQALIDHILQQDMKYAALYRDSRNAIAAGAMRDG